MLNVHLVKSLEQQNPPQYRTSNFYEMAKPIHMYQYISYNYKEAKSQRLKREEANDKNQDKKAIAEDN